MHPALHNIVFLDTETTGLDNAAQVVEIGIVAGDGRILVDTLVRPTCQVSDGAAAVHGITAEQLDDAPELPEVWEQVRIALDERGVHIYNADFDLRMLRQSAQAHNLPTGWLVEVANNSVCVMRQYAAFYGSYDPHRHSYRWQSLSAAIDQQRLVLPPGLRLHSAVADAEMTRQLVIKMIEQSKR